MPSRAIRWILAERYGYTLEYIDNMHPRDFAEEAQVQDAIARYQNSKRKKK